MVSRTLLVGALMVCTVVQFGHALPNGAPSKACGDMTPQHGVAAQTTPSPYTIQVSSAQVSPGQAINVTLGIAPGTGVPHFKGLLVRGSRTVRDPEASGDVELMLGGTSSIRSLECEGGLALTHSDPSAKTAVTFEWRAPNDPGDYHILATFAQEWNIFWVKQPSQTITVA